MLRSRLKLLVAIDPVLVIRPITTKCSLSADGFILDLGRSAHSDLRVRKRKRPASACLNLAKRTNVERPLTTFPRTAPSRFSRWQVVFSYKSFVFGLSASGSA